MQRVSRKATYEEDQKHREFLRYKFQLGQKANLSEAEQEELANFEFYRAPISIPEQIRRYYLFIKNEHPERAADFDRMTGATLKAPEITEMVIVQLYATLMGFIKGFVLHHNGKVWHG